MQERSGAGVIEVTAGVTFLHWGYHYFWDVLVEIDGILNQAKWGTNHFDASLGRHNVKIYIKTPLIKEGNAASTDVTVEEGKVTRIKYTLPVSGMGAGTLHVEGGMAMPMASTPAASSQRASANAVGIEPRGDRVALGEPGPAGATCANCGVGLVPGARFCRECGTPVSAATRACPSCGNQQSAGKFCANCGTQIGS